MTRCKVKEGNGPIRVVFDGQSQNLVGLIFDDPLRNYSYPQQLMRGRNIPWSNVAISGTGWDTLAETAEERLHPLSQYTDKSILILCGGTANILDDQSSQDIYDLTAEYADNAIAAGFTSVIGTTLVPSTVFSSNQDNERLAYNELMIADASEAFDAVIDLDVSPLNNPEDTSYYFDGTHWWYTGAAIVASLIAPALESLL